MKTKLEIAREIGAETHHHYQWDTAKAKRHYEPLHPELVITVEPWFYTPIYGDALVVEIRISASDVVYLVGRRIAS